MVTDTKPAIERRSFHVAEIRAPADGEGRTITGHAAVFNELSAEMLGFREKIEPGAFAESIEQDDVRELWNHDAGDVLGRTRSGTLRLVEDELGLAFEIDVAETQVGRDALVSIRRGDVDDMSFGFLAIEDEWTQESGEAAPTRTLKKVRLLDVSPVTFPAYPQTDVAVRSLEAWRAEQEAPRLSGLTMRMRRQRLAEAED